MSTPLPDFCQASPCDQCPGADVCQPELVVWEGASLSLDELKSAGLVDPRQRDWLDVQYWPIIQKCAPQVVDAFTSFSESSLDPLEQGKLTGLGET